MNQKIGLGVIVMITLGITIGTSATILSQQQQAQASTLSSESALASTDIVNSISTTYEILFTTTTTDTIAKVLVIFPSGFGLSNMKTLEVSGIGSLSSTSISGQTVTFTLSSPVSISAGTKIRIEVGNIKNPINAAGNYQVSVTTKRSDDSTIDGPTSSSAFSIRKIGSATISDNSISTNMIRNGTVTGTKIAGTSKLVFVQCPMTISPTGPGGTISIYCSNKSVAEGDSVVATLNQYSCYDLSSAAAHDRTVEFDFKNECSSATTLGSFSVSALVFKPTS
jgi:hypothetical protein